ncbi:hypothetical protein TanjilG_05068 [Lupinus angustifolius]|uniref:Uncharacterized protein n=1 Tax=Lupinus angustifolius TaxID=3871 RepID=A0A4P1R5E7_LUPAN|nr:hypothetical protein TanjilG_05068 [Lupinus angustifolius]
MQRRMMMGLGTVVGMSNLRNGIVGLGPMGNPIRIGAARGLAGTGISTPMTSMVVSTPQVGSQSTMGVPPMNKQVQQQAIPQQMSQRTPMSLQQMSSGAIHAATSAGIPEPCPESPQMSSQTLGPINNITNSPMDMQGVNKNNSVSNGQ